MKVTHLIITAAIFGAIFAILVRYMGMSPSKYMLDHYGWIGLIIYAAVMLSVSGFLLYHVAKYNQTIRNKKQSCAKE